MGARKIVLVSLSPLGCLPSQLFKMGSLNGQCIAEVNDLAMEYNAILADNLHGLRRHLPGAKLVYNDAYLAFNNITNHAASFGILH
jgi:phospholipase/lecithinase/hemolysin